MLRNFSKLKASKWMLFGGTIVKNADFKNFVHVLSNLWAPFSVSYLVVLETIIITFNFLFRTYTWAAFLYALIEHSANKNKIQLYLLILLISQYFKIANSNNQVLLIILFIFQIPS